MTRKHDGVGLQVVADLFERRILEQRLERRERFIHRELRSVVHALMAERKIPRRVRGMRERDADDGRRDRGAVGEHAQREAARGAQLPHELGQFLGRCHEPVVARGCFGRRRVLHHERTESELGEEGVRVRRRRPAVLEIADIEFHGNVGVDAQQLAARQRFSPVREQRLAVFFLRHVRRPLEERVERSVRGDQLARAFFADAGDALDVVDRVAHQREDVHDLLRHHAEFFLHAGGVVPRAFVPRVEHANPVAHELEEVLVSRHDRHAVAFRCRPLRHRADHIVGFVARVRDDGDAERLAGAVHERNLHGEVVGHGRPVRLVVGGQIVAKRAPGQIEGRGDELRRVLVEELPQHRDENINGVGGRA